ncbi:MAG: AIR synthase related protein, partial [Candidatus Hodarchaeota archaeon]
MLENAEIETINRNLNRQATAVERAILDAMWSEHCSYKSSLRWLKLFDDILTNRVFLGPGEGAGLVKLSNGNLIGLALESHNHPSAIDPVNGAATGVGGIIRDIASQGCKPIALLDSLHFGNLSSPHSRFLFENVVLGISSYGNCVGLPNAGGDLEFSLPFEDNCLVNIMCVGLAKPDQILRSKADMPGSKFIIFGSTTGRDGIGGVTFASEELDENSSEYRSAVQIGD